MSIAESGNLMPFYTDFVSHSKLGGADRVDEGYADETLEPDYEETFVERRARQLAPVDNSTSRQAFLVNQIEHAMSGMSEDEKAETITEVLRGLQASTLTTIFNHLWPRLHSDPLRHLPPELMSLVLSELCPKDLIRASSVSRAWRAQVRDAALWRNKYEEEGWRLSTSAIEKADSQTSVNSFENESHMSNSPQSNISRFAVDERFNNIKSSREQIFGKESTMRSPKKDIEMSDAEQYNPAIGYALGNNNDPYIEPEASTPQDNDEMQGICAHDAVSERLQSTKISSPLAKIHFPSNDSLDFQNIYRQRRRLENNWADGEFKNFQLPHRDHPDEAHEECVYTLQFRGDFLVSGSRDRSIRIWDLSTGRLIRKPLRGHTGSVLCLQFDEAASEDIIISGSSDSSVILWRFSTGELLRRIPNAHRESVLNLRFDHRFLVTCSKDSTIKMWNRRPLMAGDPDYPIKGVENGGECPAYIIDQASIASALQSQPTSPEHRIQLEAYSHLMTLNLHAAAVNAIQIQGDELVSASGDKYLRVWNIHTGQCTSRMRAHEKGIACVQYDGDHIVSGSSDNTIGIWDARKETELARLTGHSKLVRTIQAAFLRPSNGLRSERRQNYSGFESKLEPHLRGSQLFDPHNKSSNGSVRRCSDVDDRWARIVSGSYDEKVLVWRKRANGAWRIQHRLWQSDALTAAGPMLQTQSHARAAMAQASDAPEPARNTLGLPTTTTTTAHGHHRNDRFSHHERVSAQERRTHGTERMSDVPRQLRRISAEASSRDSDLPDREQPTMQNATHDEQSMAFLTTTSQTMRPNQDGSIFTLPFGLRETFPADGRNNSDTLNATTSSSSSTPLRRSSANINNEGSSPLIPTRRRPPTNVASTEDPDSTVMRRNQTLDSNRPLLQRSQSSTAIIPPHLSILREGYSSGPDGGSGQRHSNAHHDDPRLIYAESGDSEGVGGHHRLREGSAELDSSTNVQVRSLRNPTPIGAPHLPRPQHQQRIRHDGVATDRDPSITRAPARAGRVPQIARGLGPAESSPDQPNSRVFKIQFDARRIICCSQDCKIVGWDFANGDEDILQCCPYFGDPE